MALLLWKTRVTSEFLGKKVWGDLASNYIGCYCKNPRHVSQRVLVAQ